MGQRPCRERTRCVLLQTPITHLAKSPQPLEHAKDVFHPSTNLGLVVVLSARHLTDDAVGATGALVGEVLGAQMVPVLTLKPLACNSLPTLANRASPSLWSLSSLRNFVMVVESGTGSRPKSTPTKWRRLALRKLKVVS